MRYVQTIAYRYHNVPLNMEPKKSVFKEKAVRNADTIISNDEVKMDLIIRLMNEMVSANTRYFKKTLILSK